MVSNDVIISMSQGGGLQAKSVFLGTLDCPWGALQAEVSIPGGSQAKSVLW